MELLSLIIQIKKKKKARILLRQLIVITKHQSYFILCKNAIFCKIYLIWTFININHQVQMVLQVKFHKQVLFLIKVLENFTKSSKRKIQLNLQKTLIMSNKRKNQMSRIGMYQIFLQLMNQFQEILIELSAQLKNPNYKFKGEFYYAKVKNHHFDKKNKKRTIEISCFQFNQQISQQIILICRDISHRNYIHSLINYCKEKSKIISFVSHEYRTPLNCIIQMLEQSIEEQSEEKKLFYTKLSLNNIKYLLGLSNDLLDYAQIKKGKFKINYALFNLKELASDCLEIFLLTAMKKEIALNLEYDNHLPEYITSDSNRIKQIIINLLANALKFTLKGEIILSISQNGAKAIQIKVSDTGIGMREQDLSHLFKAFGKAEEEYSKKLNAYGVGLGLVISNQIAQILGPNPQCGLSVSSIYQQGSSFWFSILSKEPLKESESNLDNPAYYQSSPFFQGKLQILNEQTIPKFFQLDDQKSNHCQCPKILIVDDSYFNIDVFKLMLKRLNISNCDFTISGQLAEQKVRERSAQVCCQFYHIIFMDIEMPFQDGKITSTNIKRFYKERNITAYIIGCSGYSDEKEKKQCAQAGMDDYLEKPVEKNKLQKVIDDYL